MSLKLPSSHNRLEVLHPTEMHKQIAIETVSQKYKVWLVHAVPDGYTVDTSLHSGSLSFEQAMDIVLTNQMPNLACSTVREEDKYNRFQHRFCGVIMTGGTIVYANKHDGMTWSESNFITIPEEQIPSLISDIDEAITQKGGIINEIHVDTRNGACIPYIDLDLITELFIWRDPNRYNSFEIIDRFRQYTAQKNVPFVGLIKGRLVKVGLDKLKSVLENEPNTPLRDDEIPDLSDEIKNYFNGLKKYSFSQLRAISSSVNVS